MTVEYTRSRPDLVSAPAGLTVLDELTPGDIERLRSLNSAYREKFGFPFLFAVAGRTAHDVLNAIERRLTSPRDEEHREALRQVYRIARIRLEGIIS